MDMTMGVTEKIDFIRTNDPDSAARLERLLGKRETLLDKNVYGERFTERQFSLIFNPLLDAAYVRARVLEVLSGDDDNIPGISARLGLPKDRVFTAMKELMKKNLVEIAHHRERDAIFRKK